MTIPKESSLPVLCAALWALSGSQGHAAGPLAAVQPNIRGTWQLQFQDEFDGASLDGTKWRLGGHYAGIAGVGGNSPKNVSVSGGNLRIKAQQGAMSFSGKSYAYSGGEVSSFFNYRQQYGYFEARVKSPPVNGLWPAFWLMPDRGNYGWKNEFSRAYLKFDLTGANLSQASSAALKLKVSNIESGGTNNLVFMKLQNDSWSESTLSTPPRMPPFSGGTTPGTPRAAPRNWWCRMTGETPPRPSTGAWRWTSWSPSASGGPMSTPTPSTGMAMTASTSPKAGGR
ncbi:Glycoside hydrolase, family 16 [Stigmatella aurantiaca DW4/3-1]|uniref:Glucan endo-1,3-beta-glucosidase A1 ((1->3)-beta-glucan endohydrolase) ((1->3)-beta-glucanase A1) n=1 Tax=Stigmatella aurantiaca (strain DW4/3-1) TaxID=378806 RepID=Q08N56_STIAD|nr:Glycoside hydrolase, family 16 [Stigmatella aurantiaca DW4/3-1]EAU61915.1 glucan endo-1,3-beta-glucosidase A1 ((1->3)-beta-glucan endohydrolase) ((1->3)-beta-glucanase A1) [Stigmatella aurantiaca DW4/3-1]EAU68616.1 glucan endo-1,3-beta-glucosidase A1 ((1->3)-beta-glucan endohydrolase) ((1->3)-beta-glucanase A1) [Stigmatella aurantiaca DW4/3-1]